jgi:multiple sugar transport system ATP-binding protein
MAEVVFQDVGKTYPDGTEAVKSFNFSIPDGSFIVFVGPSGCGKTTLLRMVAGLEDITNGSIVLGGRVINDVEPQARDCAMVFQNYALYPHMSVYRNMAFGLRMRKMNKRDIDERVRRTAETLGLTELLEKRPSQLSGGQRQRVAMGRAIVREPALFLMDEPLSNLDAKLRVRMRTEITRLQKDLGVTTIYVTHDQTEATTMGDIVVVMKNGVLQQADSPKMLYERPRNLFVAAFIGSPAMNLVEAAVERYGDSIAIRFGDEYLAIAGPSLDTHSRLVQYVGKTIVVGLRPESFIPISPGMPTDAQDACITTTIDLREELGSEILLYFSIAAPMVGVADTEDDDVVPLGDAASSTFVARVNSSVPAEAGDRLTFEVDPRHLHFFDRLTGAGIYRL